ncbi:MAG: hypothetical protein LBC75_09625 [Fibromonadaceae bacterium]|jgi:uncharacterized protein (TIGR02145 family)|nr:hypothetical protein [Fibromonadaceae bacterium]
MNKVKFVLFSAGILLALAFTFSCSSDDGGGSGGYELSYNYCITASNTCLTGPFTASTCTGQLSNTCPYGGSRSSVTGGDIPSSSSIDLCAGFIGGTPRNHYGKSKAQFCDSRDGKKYVYVTIGSQTWMAEDLNYAADGSKCNDNIEANCTTYGRLYRGLTAFALPPDCINNNSCNSQIFLPHRGICPAGWHIPSFDEWNRLEFRVTTADGYNTANGYSYYLRTTSGWLNGGNGSDDYGFSALPGGFYSSSDNYFYNARDYGAWWASSDDMGILGISFWYGYKQPECNGICFMSVRCIKD